MARRNGSTIQEELYATPDEPAREELDDARLLDLDAEKESPFLRAQKRVSVRRGPLPKKTAARLLWALLVIVVASLGAVGAASLYHYGEHSWRFRLESSDDIETAGLNNVTHAQVMEVLGGDIGRNIFYIPLDQRQKQLEQIPWVESASVMRFAPNHIRIQIHERTPAAFARVGSKISLIDASGVLMELSSKKKYSFPVIVGMNSGEPLSTRAARMKIYNELVRQLDSGGAHYSQDLSEVDLSDYDRQIIVNPEMQGTARQPALSPAAAKAAMAAGVKPALLVDRDPKKPSAAHAAIVKIAISKHPASPALSQKARKDGAPAVVLAKKSTRQSHWRKRALTTKYTIAKPVAKSTVVASKPQSAPVAQKPSPAIKKGQESH